MSLLLRRPICKPICGVRSCRRLLLLQCLQHCMLMPWIPRVLSCDVSAGMKVVYKVDNVPFYKHTEEFRLGRSISTSRRDKKPGQQHATIRPLQKGVEIDIQLDPPFSGIACLQS